MTDAEKTAFKQRMKKFSNLSKLGRNVDKLEAQLLLDKRRQILTSSLVKKSKWPAQILLLNEWLL